MPAKLARNLNLKETLPPGCQGRLFAVGPLQDHRVEGWAVRMSVCCRLPCTAELETTCCKTTTGFWLLLATMPLGTGHWRSYVCCRRLVPKKALHPGSCQVKWAHRTRMQIPFLHQISSAPFTEKVQCRPTKEKDHFHRAGSNSCNQHTKDIPVIFHQEIRGSVCNKNHYAFIYYC